MSEIVELRHGSGNLDPELGYQSTDACPELMGYFLEQLGLPSPGQFVSLSVQVGDKENALVRAYGAPHRLKPEHLEKVRIVCAGDFLNVMSKAVLACLREQSPICDWRHYFVELPGSMTTAERLEKLREADERNDRIGTYAEARIYGPCEEDWFENIDPEEDYEDALNIEFDNP